MKKRSSSRPSQKRTMKAKRTQESVTIGGFGRQKQSLLSDDGEILREGQVSPERRRDIAQQGTLAAAKQRQNVARELRLRRLLADKEGKKK